MDMHGKANGNVEEYWSMRDFHDSRLVHKSLASSVYIVTEEKSGVQYAMRRIIKSRACRYHLLKQVERELFIHPKLSHRNIIRVNAWFHDENSIYVICEKAEASLAHLLSHRYPSGMSEALVSSMARSISDGLVYLHSLHILHRDIKPANLLLVERENKFVVKICDFGCAVHTIPFDLRKSVCGTSPYMAPEMVEGAGYSLEVDVWAFGVSLHELLTGSLPFDGSSPMEIYRKILKEEYVAPHSISGFFRTLLIACMQKDMRKRPTSLEVKSRNGLIF